jgi:hypothetical protein
VRDWEEKSTTKASSIDKEKKEGDFILFKKYKSLLIRPSNSNNISASIIHTHPHQFNRLTTRARARVYGMFKLKNTKNESARIFFYISAAYIYNTNNNNNNGSSNSIVVVYSYINIFEDRVQSEQ